MSDDPQQSAEFLLGKAHSGAPQTGRWRLANEQETNRKLRALLIRAAEVLQLYADYPISMVMSVSLRERAEELLPELRKAAQ